LDVRRRRTLYLLLLVYDVERAHEAHELHFHVGPGRRRQGGRGGQDVGRSYRSSCRLSSEGSTRWAHLSGRARRSGSDSSGGYQGARRRAVRGRGGAYDAAWGPPGVWVVAFSALGAPSEPGKRNFLWRGRRRAAVRSDRYVVRSHNCIFMKRGHAKIGVLTLSRQKRLA